ncbi:MAG: TolC family protein [Taibaiella sp.]|nr:TolC family protein [Taibaiella sp.]
MFTTQKYISILLTGLSLGIGACGIPSKVSRKENIKVPEQYTGINSTDSASVAQLNYRDFFKDTHLTAIIDEVLQNNYDQRIAEEQLKIASAYLLARKGALLPSVQAGINASGTRYGKHTIEGVGNFDTNLSPNIDESQKVNTSFTPNYWLGLSVGWEIDIWGKLASLKKAAQKRFLATQQARDLVQATLVTQAASLYYELVTLDKMSAILKDNIKLQEQALEIVNIQKEVGRATELAVQQFNAQLSNTEASWVEIQQQTTDVENQLLALMGRFEGTIKRSEKIEPAHLPLKMDHGHPAQLLSYRPDIQMAYSELEAIHADAKAARAAFFPTISLSAYGAYNAFNSSYLFNPTSLAYQLLGNMVAPVFQQNQLKSQFKVATAQQEIAFLEYQRTVVGAFQEVKTLIRYIENNQKILDFKSKEVSALANSVEISNDLYVTGYANYLEIINAQRSKRAADLDQVQARRNQAQAMIQLYKALGGGWQ